MCRRARRTNVRKAFTTDDKRYGGHNHDANDDCNIHLLTFLIPLFLPTHQPALALEGLRLIRLGQVTGSPSRVGYGQAVECLEHRQKWR